MRVLYLSKLSVVLLLLLSLPAIANENSNEAMKLLPDKIGDTKAQSPAMMPPRVPSEMTWATGSFSVASRQYISTSGQKFNVGIKKMESDSAAFADLTGVGLTSEGGRWQRSAQVKKIDNVGTAAFALPDRVFFYKGATVVTISSLAKEANSDELINFAQQFAETLDKGTGEIPPLVKHLPAWEAAQERAFYAVKLAALQAFIVNQPVLDAVSFEGGTEAVTAHYDQGQLVIIEFATPQLAADNDARIVERIAELRGQNQPVPSGYKRVGNYSVFVFDAPNEQEAVALIDQVKYEKVVQWLGDDPHRFERANRFWLNMSGSIIINTIKATALAILLCLGIGGIFGSVIFARRRAQAALRQQYTDAGGMVRLNLDELAAQPSRLLPPGDD